MASNSSVTGLNLTTTTNGTSGPATVLTLLQNADFMLVESKIVLSALGIIYLGSHAALRRPPSAAVSDKEKSKGRKRNDEDLFTQGLEPSDAILFPILAAIVLVGLYYLIQWLKDPALLNKILRCYISTVSLASVLTFYAHGMDLATSFVFPTYWRAGDGTLREAHQKTRSVAVCDDAGNQTGPAVSGASPVPASLGMSQRVTRFAWELRSLLTRHWLLKLYVHGRREESVKIRFSHVMALLLSIATALVYFSTTSPFLSNVLGYATCYGAFLILSPTDFLTASLVLCGLFFYDILMVFYTPYMVTVATTLDVPIKLTFGAASRQSMLGLGDIVIPGMVIAWALRLDLWLHYSRKVKHEPTVLTIVEKDASSGEIVRRSETKHKEIKTPYVDVKNKWGDGFWTRGPMFSSRPQTWPPNLAAARFSKVYFHTSMAGYLMGMGVTLAMLLVFEQGQPALLYLVPGVLGSMTVTALARGEIKHLWKYTEDGSLDTVDVVVDLDADGNAIKTVGLLEDGVVDTTRDQKDRDKKKQKQKEEEEEEARAARAEAATKSNGHKVFAFSIEAPGEEEYRSS